MARRCCGEGIGRTGGRVGRPCILSRESVLEICLEAWGLGNELCLQFHQPV